MKKQHIGVRLAVPGHKGLLWASGDRGSLCEEGTEAAAIDGRAVTGARSREREQPMEFPEGYEAGTVNRPGDHRSG